MDPFTHWIIAIVSITVAYFYGKREGMKLGISAIILSLEEDKIIRIIRDSDDNVIEITKD